MQAAVRVALVVVALAGALASIHRTWPDLADPAWWMARGEPRDGATNLDLAALLVGLLALLAVGRAVGSTLAGATGALLVATLPADVAAAVDGLPRAALGGALACVVPLASRTDTGSRLAVGAILLACGFARGVAPVLLIGLYADAIVRRRPLTTLWAAPTLLAGALWLVWQPDAAFELLRSARVFRLPDALQHLGVVGSAIAGGLVLAGGRDEPIGRLRAIALAGLLVCALGRIPFALISPVVYVTAAATIFGSRLPLAAQALALAAIAAFALNVKETNGVLPGEPPLFRDALRGDAVRWGVFPRGGASAVRDGDAVIFEIAEAQPSLLVCDTTIAAPRSFRARVQITTAGLAGSAFVHLRGMDDTDTLQKRRDGSFDITQAGPLVEGTQTVESTVALMPTSTRLRTCLVLHGVTGRVTLEDVAVYAVE